MDYYHPADLRKRFIAHLLDLGVILILHLFILGIESESFIVNFLLLSLYGIVLFYTYGRDSLLNGQSIGKKIMGLAVVKYDNQTKRIGFNQAVLRNLAFLIPFSHLIMAFQIEYHPSHRRLGDGLAKTIVVDLSKKSRGPFKPKKKETFFGVDQSKNFP